MKYLEKIWVRAIVSLLAGGMVQEIVHISTGDPNRPETPGISLIFLITVFVTFFVLSMAVKQKK